MAILILVLLIIIDCSVAYASTQLVKENSDIVFICPFRVESKSIVWLGPKEEKLTTYIVGKLINPNISSYSRIRLIGNHSNGEYNLQILNVSSNDVGTYQCQSVQNGTAVQRTFLLKISEFPVTIQPTSANCNASDSHRVTLLCQVDVEDTNDWQNVWLHSRNDNFIKNLTGLINGSKSTLYITGCDYRVQGNYTCKWMRKFKEFSASAFVTVNGPPSITETEYWKEHQDICMKVIFYSVPKANTIYWFDHDKELVISKRISILLYPSVVKLNYSDKIFKEDGFVSQLCVSDVRHIDLTSYRWQVVNIYGSVEYTFLDYWIDKIFYQHDQSTNEKQSTKVYIIQQDITLKDDASTHVGIPLKFALIGSVVVIVLIMFAIAALWFHQQRYTLKVFAEYEGHAKPGYNVQYRNEHSRREPEENEEIGNISMTVVY
ncbi:uncharacterized protein LOC127713076 isoform X1 [Mytilus californianus]|uniref:uncharacterized protein LOC127713076 isoform X1 n=1 Tax=Mytilus californianus TaxID=6549 RepID=UPI002246263A|nr:uncharacterized protein LOC127713076 isoform X1 [Mytilus californianus]